MNEYKIYAPTYYQTGLSLDCKLQDVVHYEICIIKIYSITSSKNQTTEIVEL